MATNSVGAFTTSVNYLEAKKFIDCLYGTGAHLTFQTFDNGGTYLVRPEKLFGTLDQHWKHLVYVNSRGMGVYVMVNRGDGKDRTNENVTAITALFVDLDNAPLGPVLSSPLKPHAVLQTSTDRFQVRWKLDPIPVTGENLQYIKPMFRKVQLALAKHFGGDLRNTDIARVGRLPGLFNHKRTPFLVQNLELNDISPYSIMDFIKTFSINLKERVPQSDRAVIPIDFSSLEPVLDGTRHDFIFSVASILARRGVSPDVILETAHEQNKLRCKPPIDDADVRSQVKSVCNYWYSAKVNVGEIVTTLMEDYKLLWFRGSFYRYDTRTGTYRASDIRKYRYRVQQETKKDNAAPGDVARVIARLAEMVATDTPPSANPESAFLSENLPTGQKVVLSILYGNYHDWCRSKNIRPVSQTELRQEVEARLNIMKTKIRKGRKVVWGFDIPNEC